MSLEGRVCLVTGAGRGIGRAIAARLAGEGAAVVVNDHDPGAAEACAAELLAGGGRVDAHPADVSRSDQVRGMFASIGERHGRLDVLVNNAAVSRPASLVDTGDELWRQVIGVNLDGVFFCCREAFPLMERSGGGRIVNLSSVSAYTGKVLSENASYIAAKAGVDGLTRALAWEGMQCGITVNAVAPGIVETDIHASLAPERKDRLPALVPMGRLATADEVADAVFYLVSGSARYMTGQVLHLNGGMYMA